MRRVSLSLLVVLAWSACNEKPGRGAEGELCRPNGDCDENLACVSSRCVDAQEAIRAGLKETRDSKAELAKQALEEEKEALQAEIERKNREIEALIAEKDAAYEALMDAKSERQKREAQMRLEKLKENLQLQRKKMEKEREDGVLDDRLIDTAPCDPNDPICAKRCDPNDPLCGL